MGKARDLRAAAFFVACLLFQWGCSSSKPHEPDFRFDLSQYGLKTDTQRKLVTSYSSIGFLSNDLLLVSVNQREWTSPVELSNTDVPASKVFIIDVKKKSLVTSGELRIEKAPDSIQVVSDQRFVIKNESGIQLCDVHLVCERPVIENTRRYNFEKIKILETETGRPIFEVSFDPRPYVPALTLPALSPDGRSLAVIRNGELEIYSTD